MVENGSIKVSISGHADSTGDPNYNLSLSKLRADAVAKYLMGNEVAADRIKVEFYGEEKPIESNNTREGRRKNRRVEFTILEK